MAEGGKLPDCQDNILPILSDSHLLECPICLEQLRQPKFLPCRHSFCEECLSIYIVAETSRTTDTTTSFICPVCRSLTLPVDKTKDKEKWAQQFPTDIVSVEMIQMRNKTTGENYCTPCEKRKENMVPAQFWCKATQSLFCESCKVDFHDNTHFGCDIADMNSFKVWQLSQNPSDKRCGKHKKKISYYCEDHKTLGCTRCITVDHRKCDVVFTTEEYYNKLNKNSSLEEGRTFLQQAAVDLESTIKEFYRRQQIVTDDKDVILKTIDDLEERMNKRIRQMKKGITDDVITAYKEATENLKMPTQKCERLIVAIHNTLESSATALQRNDHMSTIRLYQKGQTEVEATKILLKDIQSSISSVGIEHEIDSDVTSLNFGKVVVRKQRKELPCALTLIKPLSQCEVREVRKVNVKRPSDRSDCSACGVVYFPDGSIVVGDNNNKKIKLINSTGEVVDELVLDVFPCDLCMVDNTTVAAASSGGIHEVTVTPSKLTLCPVLKISNQCYGITHRDDRFIVSTGSEVCSIQKDGTTETLFRYTDEVFTLSHDSKNGQVFVSNCCNERGQTAIGRLSTDNQYTDVLEFGVVKNAFGVDVDVEGNVYVCGWSSNNVVQMSGDGTNIRELITARDGIKQPRAISVCGDKMVVTNGSDQRNYIQVFELV